MSHLHFTDPSETTVQPQAVPEEGLSYDSVASFCGSWGNEHPFLKGDLGGTAQLLL